MSSSSSADQAQEVAVYPFNYVPSFVAGITFVALFGCVTIVHLIQAVRSRMWWLFPTVITGGVAEIIGWSGRLWGSKSPYSMDPYLMQITTTIISPTFVLAANFIVVGRIILLLGPQYSRLKPSFYTVVFCSCDIVALIVQSIGGAKASMSHSPKDATEGGHIALGGIVFQFFAIVVYMLVTAEFLIRYYLDKPFPNRANTFIGKKVPVDSKMKQMIFAVYFSSLCMFIRGVYRTIELTDGWSGKVISNERLFIGFDGSMICLAMVTLSIFHPGRLMRPDLGLMKLGDQSVVEMWSKAGFPPEA